MAKLTLQEVEYVAALARVELSDAEKESLTEQLARILGYIEQLNELDTSNVEPTSHVLPIRNVTRKDVVGEPMSREEALKLAPASNEQHFEAPRVIE